MARENAKWKSERRTKAEAMTPARLKIACRVCTEKVRQTRSRLEDARTAKRWLAVDGLSAELKSDKIALALYAEVYFTKNL